MAKISATGFNLNSQPAVVEYQQQKRHYQTIQPLRRLNDVKRTDQCATINGRQQRLQSRPSHFGGDVQEETPVT